MNTKKQTKETLKTRITNGALQRKEKSSQWQLHKANPEVNRIENNHQKQSSKTMDYVKLRIRQR